MKTSASIANLAGVTRSQLRRLLPNIKLILILNTKIQVRLFEPKGEVNELSFNNPHRQLQSCQGRRNRVHCKSNTPGHLWLGDAIGHAFELEVLI